MNKFTGILRTVGLWALLICDTLLIIVLFWKDNPIWGIFFLGITIWTIGFEIWGKFFSKEKKTISTMYKDWAIKVGWWAYLALGFFITAMAGLTLHLAVWGG